MADQFDLRGYLEWDSKLAPGDPVQARWTNSGNYYRVAAHIKTASKSSIRVTLDRDVYGYSTHGPQALIYQKGREIVVPRGLMTRTWSQNNGAFPPGSAKEIGSQKENAAPRERVSLHRRLYEALSDEVLFTESVEDGIKAFVAHLKAMTDAYFAKNYTNLTPPTWEITSGPRFVRIVKADAPGSSRSVYCFVEKSTGLIWKAAGWKAPALNFPRGNVNDPSSWGAHFGPHGVVGAR
jgi:hypothetical protein